MGERCMRCIYKFGKERLPNVVLGFALSNFGWTMGISLVLKSAIFENGKYQHFFAGDFAQGSRVRKGDLAKYRSFHENWTPYPL